MKKALTLIEVLLSIAIITIIFGLSVPFYQTFQIDSAFNTTISDIRQNLYRAESLARNSEEDSSWGSRIENQQIYLYKGNDFSNRNQNFDEITSLPRTITVSGNPDINFNKSTGIPNHNLIINITSTTHKTASISINAQGEID